MKITYIVGTFPKLSETFVLNQITDLIEHGHEVDIISLTRSGEERVHDDVTKYNLLAHTHFLTRNSSAIGYDITEKLVTSLVFTDLIHAHFAAAPADFALRLSRLFNIPYVFTAHAYDIFIDPDRSLLREKIQHASRVITISDFNRTYLMSLLGEDVAPHIDVIRCGIDLAKFHYVNRAQQQSKRILFTGRFVEKKGVPDLIDAFVLVVREHPDAELYIVGDGPLRKEVEAKIAASPAAGSIRLMGGLPQSEVVRAMEEADIVALPSVTAPNGDREGVPVVLMEAMAMGLPVVSTVHSGIPELVEDGKTGFLVPEHDINAFADRINRLLASPAMRIQMGKEGRKIVTTVHDHRIEMQRLEHLFNALMEGRTSVSVMQKKQRALIEQRVRDIAATLIGVRADQLQKIEQSLLRYDDRLKKIDDVVKLLADLKQKDEQLRQREQQLAQENEVIAQKDRQLIQKDEQLKEKVERIKEKEEQIRQKDEQLVQKDVHLRDKADRLKQKDDQLRQKDDQLEQKDGQLRLKDEQLLHKDERISWFDVEQKKSEQQILHYRSQLEQTQEELRQAVETIAHSGKLLDEQGGQLKNLGTYVETLASLMKEHEARIRDLQKTSAEKDQSLQQRDNKIKMLESDIRRQNDELAILRKWLGDITASFPYRVFKKFLAPIRDLLKKKSDVNKNQPPQAPPSTGKREEIVYLPDWSRANPYQKMLYDAISANGIPCRGMQGKDFTAAWLWNHRRRVQIIHLHWLFGIYDPGTTGITLLKAFRFIGKILLARLLGYRLFWTVHNFISHEATNPALETLVRKAVARFSEILIVHCNHAKQMVCSEWNVPDQKVHVKPMGSYVGFYKNTVSREESRKKLGIPANAFTFLFFGMVRKYKGIPNLIDAFKELKQSHLHLHLIIAGIPHNPGIKQEIEALCNDPNILVRIEHVPDDEVQYYFNACDVVVLPFLNILSTSSALLAFTFNKTTVLPRKGCIPELVFDGVGYLYDRDDQLKETMRVAMKYVGGNPANDSPRRLAERLEWKSIVRDTYLPAINRKPERKTLLIITNYIPQFDRAAGCFRLYHIIKGLVREYNVIIYAEWFHKHYVAGDDKYSKALQDLGVEVFLPFEGEGQTKKKLRELLTTRPIHAVVIEFFHITNINIGLIRELRPELPVIVDSVDVRFHRLEMMADIQKSDEVRKNAAETKEQELRAYATADAVWAITPYDRDVIHRSDPDINIDIVPMLHPIPETYADRKSRRKNTLLFVGGFNHPPNADAVIFFCEEILPLVRKKIKDIKFVVVGDSPPPEVQKLKSPNVEIAGYVPDLKPYLDSAYLSVVPLRFGAGMKGKVGEALSYGLPVVTTNVGAQGMGLGHMSEVWIADEPKDFAAGIITLMTDDRLYDRLVQRGRQKMSDAFSAERGVRTVLDLLQATITRGRTVTVPHD